MFTHSIFQAIKIIEQIYLVNRLLDKAKKSHTSHLSEFRNKQSFNGEHNETVSD